ncbi:MAG TPA: ABC-type transport auxiliary lipoprotein family protein [Rhodocyclaceae bacterium]|nr:ABC-type transport auxiliary lipoprotein family protein [Rhodocyclaceae bacterium]
MIRAWALSLSCLLAACVGGMSPRAPSARFDLGPLPVAPENKALAGIRLDVRAASWLDSTAMSYRLLYGDPAERRSYRDSRWVAQPAELIATRLGRLLGGAIVTDGAQAGTCLLHAQIDEFIHDYDTPDAGRAIVKARLLLSAGRSGRVSRAFNIDQPAQGAGAAAGVRALGLATDRLAREIAAWLAEPELVALLGHSGCRS